MLDGYCRRFLYQNCVIGRWSRGESICIFSLREKIMVSMRSSPHRVRIEQASTGRLHRIGSIPDPIQKRNAPARVRFFFGGAEGNRTPVRKQLGKTFSGCSLLFTFPLSCGNKHSQDIGSFIMHGTRKALRTHGLHSDHTRARLVDLPGRMGA